MPPKIRSKATGYSLRVRTTLDIHISTWLIVKSRFNIASVIRNRSQLIEHKTWVYIMYSYEALVQCAQQTIDCGPNVSITEKAETNTASNNTKQSNRIYVESEQLSITPFIASRNKSVVRAFLQ